MIGKKVEFPVSPGCYVAGIVTCFDEDSGKVSVRDQDGQIWTGYEYQCTVTE